ncbi:MAG TPA: DNA polymerase Y family protein [Burkholderiales bacterium]|nr:DNA polymerase Y family protein [Burkholderiales bacterium]
MLWVALHFPPLPPATLEHLAAWACQFTPRVSLEPPQALLAEVQGSLRYFGGLDALVARMRDGLGGLGFAATLAVAATPRAALWRARGENRALEELPLSVTGFETDFFRSIGVSTVGEILRLPREGLARRCGQAILDDLDRALGARHESRVFFAPPERFDATLELPGAVTQAEGVLFAARRLLARLEGLLAARQEGVRGFVLTLIHPRREMSVEIGLASTARDTERFARLLHEKLSGVVLREPVEAIRLRAQDFAPLHPASAGMFGDARAEGEEWARLVERVQARLGAGAVHGLTVQPDHRPEHAWRRVEPGEWDPREFVPPGPRPAWLLDPPRRLPRMEYELLAGPERIECGWWEGDDAKRDYFVAREGASLLWIYREMKEGDWFLHGVFA